MAMPRQRKLAGFFVVYLYMDYSYQVKLPTNTFSVGLQDKTVWLGSCFAENMGNYLAQCQLPVLVNPLGIAFNPLDVAWHITQALCLNDQLLQNTIFEQKGIYLSWRHHGSKYGVNNEALLTLLKNSYENLRQQLLDAKLLVLTWGTAWAYKHIDLNMQVANCHKSPAGNFEKTLIEPDEIIKIYQEVIVRLKEVNPKIKVLITVSPVKYLAWGAFENQLGKSSLFLALNHLLKQPSDIHYFPAYEIMNDELRDYRFYDTDLAHPNSLAIHHIRLQLMDWLLNQECKNYLSEYEKVSQMAKHRLLHPESEESIDFNKNLNKKILELTTKYPFVVAERIYKTQ